MGFLCLILFVFEINPWLIIVNIVVAAFDGFEHTIYNILYDTIYFTEVQDKKCWVKGLSLMHNKYISSHEKLGFL
jgi:Na+/pantothenate symporter